MSKIERFKRKDATYDTMEIEYDIDRITGKEHVLTVSIFNPDTGDVKLKFYYSNDKINKIEAFSIGHDVDESYIGKPTAVYKYSDTSNGFIRCEFVYMRSETKKYMTGVLDFKGNSSSDIDSKLIESAHYLPDGVNIANIIKWDSVDNIYNYTEYKIESSVHKVVISAKFSEDKVPTGIWKIHSKSLIDNKDIYITLDTVIGDFINDLVFG